MTVPDISGPGLEQGEEAVLIFAYRGHSMAGTFREGDLLGAVPVSESAIRPGDVIAFYKTEPDGAVKRVAHRVKRCLKDGFVTQGDGDPLPDPQTVPFESVIGRVELVLREGRRSPVLRGRAGQLWAAHLWLRSRVKQAGRWPYSVLKQSGIVRRLWHPRIEQIRVASAEGTWVKYIHRQRIVARWLVEENRFWCRKPYDLIIERPAEKS